ncbi:YrdB family protein [Micromonospora sp. NBC_01699]|uniref:YrdB family protein n=1 Tax=Micromonospora sp. NBC_01699 TaxID=2975984 RepID=UPI002E349852|nr:YrdB family protein [Micromonospora sp. NBC_01699]
MRIANLCLRFLLELCALVALAYGGWLAGGPQLWQRLLLAVLFPVAAALIWGRWVAPRSDRKLADPARLIPEWVVFGGATAVLVASGHPYLGAALAVLAAGNRLLLWRLGSDTDGRVVR